MSLETSSFSLFLKKLRKDILDTIFPLHCLGCDKKGTWLCKPCRSAIPRRIHQVCPLCLKHTTPYGQVCFGCKDKTSSPLDGLFVVSFYKRPLLKYLIHSYKYRFLSDLSYPLGKLLVEELRKFDIPLPDLVLPVPLHKRRLRFRGFNQSERLASYLASNLAPTLTLPLENDLLLRIRYTTPQMRTESKEEREKNLRNAFALNPLKQEILQSKNIWLVDDVATTGTTLEECATILKKHGAKSVFGIVLAR